MRRVLLIASIVVVTLASVGGGAVYVYQGWHAPIFPSYLFVTNGDYEWMYSYGGPGDAREERPGCRPPPIMLSGWRPPWGDSIGRVGRITRMLPAGWQARVVGGTGGIQVFGSTLESGTGDARHPAALLLRSGDCWAIYDEEI